MTDREIMQQALDAILAARESELLHPKPFQNRYLDIIGKLEAALAQPEQEPVAWKYDWYGHKSEKEPRALVKDWIASVYSEVSDPTINAHNIRPLYAAPPRKPWQGLTSEDWENTPDTGKQGCERDAELFDWIEKTLKDKNDTF